MPTYLIPIFRYFLLPFLLLGVFALDLCGLERLPLWWDEGISIAVAQLSPAELIVHTAQTDVHPPAYYLFLAAWVRLVGASPWATRYFSVLGSVVLAAGVYVLGRQRDQQTGVIALVCCGGMPFVWHYAQEVRMYSWAMALVSLATYVFCRILTNPTVTWQHKCRHFLLLLLGIYTHYAFITVFIAQTLILLLFRRQKQLVAYWLFLSLAVAGSYGFWMVYASAQWQRLQTDRLAGFQPLTIVQNLLSLWDKLINGYGENSSWLLPALFFGLVIISIANLSHKKEHPHYLLIVTLLTALVAAALTHYNKQEGLTRIVRLAFPALPPLLVLAAHGGRDLLQWKRYVGGAVIMGTMVGLMNIIANVHQRPIPIAEDYRPLIGQLEQLVQPNDAILLSYDWQRGYLWSYAPKLPVQFYTSHDQLAVFNQHDRVWVITYLNDVQQLNNPFHRQLHGESWLALGQWFGNSQLSLFIRPVPMPARFTEHQSFTDTLTLSYLPINQAAKTGDVLAVFLYWSGATAVDGYQTFVHLGQADSPPIAQSDHPLLLAEEEVDRHLLIIPADVPAQTYWIYAGIYHSQTGQRLPLNLPSGCDQENRVCLGQVEIH